MRRNNSKRSMILFALLFMFVLFTICVKVYDVDQVGPNQSDIGFSTFNIYMKNLIGTNKSFYIISDWLGLIPVLIGLTFGVVGLVQLIKRRSIKKVDMSIVCLGVFYVLLIIMYVFFETVVINYRPILIDGYLEPSYPSTHVMITVCVMISTSMMIQDLIKSDLVKKVIRISLYIVLIMVVVGRIFSGVHWMTDIIGGGLLSAFFIALFSMMLNMQQCNKKQ